MPVISNMEVDCTLSTGDRNLHVQKRGYLQGIQLKRQNAREINIVDVQYHPNSQILKKVNCLRKNIHEIDIQFISTEPCF